MTKLTLDLNIGRATVVVNQARLTKEDKKYIVFVDADKAHILNEDLTSEFNTLKECRNYINEIENRIFHNTINVETLYK